MKNKIYNALTVLAIQFAICNLQSAILSAQPSNEADSKPQQEKRKAMKIGMISSEMELTPAEAEKFWPVYNELEKSKEKLREEQKNKMGKLNPSKGAQPDQKTGASGENGSATLTTKGKVLSDQEYEALLQSEFEFRQKMLDLDRAFYGKLKSVVSPKKVVKLYEAERKFMRNKKARSKRIEKNKEQPEIPSPPPPHGNPDNKGQ